MQSWQGSTWPGRAKCLAAAGVWVAMVTAGAQGQCEVTHVAAADPSEQAEFAIGQAIDDDLLVVGAIPDIVPESSPGAAYVFRFDGTDWRQEAKLTASDGEPGDRFGSPSVSGDVAIIGAYTDDHVAVDAGSAYVFRFDGDTWIEEQKLTASDAEAHDAFGMIISLVGDIALIAAPREDEGGDGAGAVYVFRFDGQSWVEETKIVPPGVESRDGFGYPVVLGACGNVGVIGSYGDDDNGVSAGATYVYRFDGTQWIEEDKLTASDGEANDLFGLESVIHDDLIVVGAEGDDDAGDGAGAAYVFRYAGGQWTEEAKLVAPDGEAGDRFGGAAAIGSDFVIVSAINDDDGGSDAGCVHMYRFEGSTWSWDRKLTPSTPGAGDWFGNSLACDGDVIGIGARFDDDGGTNAGSAYVFAGLRGVDYNGNGVADVCEALCPADTDGDRDVDFDDLLRILSDWGGCS